MRIVDTPRDDGEPEKWADILEDNGVIDELPVNRRKYLALASGFGSATALSALGGCTGQEGSESTPKGTETQQQGDTSTPMETTQATQGDLETVRIATIVSPADLPMFIAQEEGYFADRGIEVEFSQIVSGAKVTAQLSTGQLDATGASIGASTINAIAGGINLNVVADMTRFLPNLPSSLTFLAREEVYSEGMTLADTEGLTWAINAEANVTHHHVARALEANGLSFDDITLEAIPFPQMVSALGSGAVDIAQEVGALVAVAKQNAGAKHIEYTMKTSPNSQVAQLTFGAPFVNQRREVAVKFIEAYILGIRDLWDTGPYTDRSVRLWTKYTDQSEGALKAGVPFWTHRNGGPVNVESLLNQQEFYNCMGFLDESVGRNDIILPEIREEALETVGGVEEDFPTPADWERYQENTAVPLPPAGEPNVPGADACGGAGSI